MASKVIWVTGANGQLGSEFKVLAKSTDEYQLLFTDRQQLDICDKSQAEQFCRDHDVDVIINCAAYTAVDKAESEPEAAERVNHLAVFSLSELAKDLGISLIHVSTDYVFDGCYHSPYTENHITKPQGVYGQTKLAGEQAMRDVNPSKSVIVRTSWVYSSFGNNFVKTMLRLGAEKEELGVVADQVGTPTYARDLAEAILQMIPSMNNADVEVYHYSNEGVASWYDFSLAIMELFGLSCSVKPISTSDYPTSAKRPAYSVLDKSKVKADFKVKIPHWRESLKHCLSLLEKK